MPAEAIAADLGMVADAAQEPVHDPWRAPAAFGEDAHSGGLDVHAEDPGRAPDDLRELFATVVVEPVDRPEPVAQRRAQPPGARRGADDREGLQGQAQAPRAGAAP